MRLKETEQEDLGPSSFELLLRLGRGAFGEVFHVRQKGNGHHFAMKVLHKAEL